MKTYRLSSLSIRHEDIDPYTGEEPPSEYLLTIKFRDLQNHTYFVKIKIPKYATLPELIYYFKNAIEMLEEKLKEINGNELIGSEPTLTFTVEGY